MTIPHSDNPKNDRFSSGKTVYFVLHTMKLTKGWNYSAGENTGKTQRIPSLQDNQQNSLHSRETSVFGDSPL